MHFWRGNKEKGKGVCEHALEREKWKRTDRYSNRRMIVDQDLDGFKAEEKL